MPNAITVNQYSFSLRVGAIYQLHTFISMVCQLYHLAADVGDIKHGLLNRPKQVPATEHHGFYELFNPDHMRGFQNIIDIGQIYGIVTKVINIWQFCYANIW